MTRHLSYPTCLKLKDIGIDQILREGDWFYYNREVVEKNQSHKPLITIMGFTDIKSNLIIKIPTESDLRDVMTVEEWYCFNVYYVNLIDESMRKNNDEILALNEKDNLHQLMADWLIEKRGK